MASTYSSLLRTELIGSGDQAGTWGNTTNGNFQYVFENAIAGYQAVTITPTSNNQVLTYVNGPSSNAALNQSIFGMLKLNAGTVSAAFNLFAPPASKTYIVWNNTSYAATFYNSTIIGNTVQAGTGATIPAGAKAYIWSDGINFYANTDTAIGNFTVVGNATVGGNLSVTGTSSFTGTATFASTASFGVGPTAPTAAVGTNTTQLATTAFVQAATGALGLGTMSTQNANNVNITGGTISGLTSLSSGSGSFSGNLAAVGSVSGSSGIFGGAVSGTTGTFTGAVSGTTGTFSSSVSGTTISGTTITASTQFSGAGTGLTGTAASLTAGNASLVQGFTPVQQGGGTGMTGNKIYIGWNGSNTLLQVDSTSLGYILTSLNFNNVAPTLTGTGASGTWSINISGVTTNTGSNGYGSRTVSSSAPSGGSNGDIWYQV